MNAASIIKNLIAAAVIAVSIVIIAYFVFFTFLSNKGSV